MAIYNEILVGRYAKTLQRLFSIKGEVPAKQLAGELMAVIPMFYGNENRFVEGWQNYNIAILSAAVAGDFSFVQLRNPPSSGVIAVIDLLTASETLADTIIASWTNLATSDQAITIVRALDQRIKGTSTCVFSVGQQAANPNFGNTPNGNTIMLLPIAANGLAAYLSDQTQELILSPGVTVRLQGNTVNQSLFANLRWRERPLEGSELL